MAEAQSTKTALRAKISFLNSVQFDHWFNKDLPRLQDKYPKFNFLRLVDVGTDRNYVWYKTR
jgi:hypothetical protein